MSFKISAGTLFKITAGVPATFDSAGYAALTWTTVGEVRDFGEFGFEWAHASSKPVALRGVQKKKTSREPGGFNLTLALDTDDAGQVIVKAGRDSATALYAAQFHEPGGDKYYCQVLVKSYTVVLGNQDSDQIANAKFEVTASSTDVDWVEVLA